MPVRCTLHLQLEPIAPRVEWTYFHLATFQSIIEGARFLRSLGALFSIAVPARRLRLILIDNIGTVRRQWRSI